MQSLCFAPQNLCLHVQSNFKNSGIMQSNPFPLSESVSNVRISIHSLYPYPFSPYSFFQFEYILCIRIRSPNPNLSSLTFSQLAPTLYVHKTHLIAFFSLQTVYLFVQSQFNNSGAMESKLYPLQGKNRIFFAYFCKSTHAALLLTFPSHCMQGLYERFCTSTPVACLVIISWNCAEGSCLFLYANSRSISSDPLLKLSVITTPISVLRDL